MPLLLRTEVVAIEGRDWVQAVVIRSAEGERRIETDGVIVTGQFRPEAALLRVSHIRVDRRTGGPEVDQFGRCSDPSYFAAGNLLRTVETAGWCWAEGRAVARSILFARAQGFQDEPGRSAQLDGDALAWVMPQRLAASDGRNAAFPTIQLRARRAARGRLVLVAEETEIFGRATSLVPERRLAVPLPPDVSTVRVSFSESAD